MWVELKINYDKFGWKDLWINNTCYYYYNSKRFGWYFLIIIIFIVLGKIQAFQSI